MSSKGVPDIGAEQLGVEDQTQYFVEEGFLVIRLPLGSVRRLISEQHTNPLTLVDSATGIRPQEISMPVPFATGVCRIDEAKGEFHVQGRKEWLARQNFTLLSLLARQVDRPASIPYLIDEMYSSLPKGDDTYMVNRRKMLQNRVSLLRTNLDKIIPGLSGAVKSEWKNSGGGRGHVVGYTLLSELDITPQPVDQQG